MIFRSILVDQKVLWVVKVERFQWNERPSCAHATSKVDQCCVQLVSSKLVFFSVFWLFRGLCIASDFVWLRILVVSIPFYTMFSWSHERTMKGQWKDNERKWEEMNGEWKEMRGNERNMKGTWKQMNPKVWVLIPFDVVRYVVRTSFGRRSKQLTVSLQNPTGKSSFSCELFLWSLAIYMWWITGVPIWHECFMLYLIPLWRCFGSCVHKVFPHLSHSKTCQNRVCRTSASHWGWPCFWSTYLTSWSNGVPMRFDTILLNWSTLTVRSKSMISM